MHLPGNQLLPALLEILIQLMACKVTGTCPPQMWFLPIQEPTATFSVTRLSTDSQGQGEDPANSYSLNIYLLSMCSVPDTGLGPRLQ